MSRNEVEEICSNAVEEMGTMFDMLKFMRSLELEINAESIAETFPQKAEGMEKPKYFHVQTLNILRVKEKCETYLEHFLPNVRFFESFV